MSYLARGTAREVAGTAHAASTRSNQRGIDLNANEETA
jgi:hypothetical protein